MIAWLLDIIGEVPEQYQFIIYITAAVLVVLVIVNVIQFLFSPFRLFK